MLNKAVQFNNTVLRDGHQSLAATRMSTQQMLGSLEDLDSLGFYSLETWGGATIDVCLRFLNENPFDRLRTLKKLTPKTPHMMLLRGQNIVQYTSFPDDIVQTFIKSAAKAGIDIFRIFDALNDIRNLEVPVKAVIAAGKHAQGAVCYTTSPVHTLDSFVKVAKQLHAWGCHSICVKDMAGLITPPAAYELIKRLKEAVPVPICLHSHSTAGLAAASYYAAIEAGVDLLDTSIAPFANGTGQPDTLLMQNLLKDHPRCTNYNSEALFRLQDFFTKSYEELEHFTSRTNEKVDVDILRYQVPGGMLSNFLTQLKEQNMADKLNEVMKEVLYVRECMGWIPLVTPTSQIVGTQAMFNVKFGRWKRLAQPAIEVILGKYGLTPGPILPELKEMAAKQTGQKPVECRPADLLTPKVEDIRKDLRAKGLPDDDESVVLYAMFPQQLETFYKKKDQPAQTAAPATSKPAPSSATSPATSNNAASHMGINFKGARYEVMIEEV